MAEPGRVLVIKLGALGDVVLAFSAFAAIRAQHPRAEMTLLTTAPFAELARRAPWFEIVETDARPAWWRLAAVARLRRQLRGFDLVYDLQTSGRSGVYFWLAGRPRWSGIARFCALPHRDPNRDRLHTLERLCGQLRDAGIGAFPAPALDWLACTKVPAVQAPYALLVPGAALHRGDKRWPADRYGQLASILVGRGLTPVVVGGEGERPLAAIIQALCPRAVDLTGQTALDQIAALAAGATLAVGNDTGPMHLAAAMGCACVVLFGPASDPGLTAPRGPGGAWPTLVRAQDLAALPVARVAAALPLTP